LTFSLKILLSKNPLGNLKSFMVAATFKLRCYTQALSLATTNYKKKKLLLTLLIRTGGERNEGSRNF